MVSGRERTGNWAESLSNTTCLLMTRTYYTSRGKKNHIFSIKGHVFLKYTVYTLSSGVPGGSVVKNLPANAGDPGSISGSGRSPGERNSNPLQYSCLENPMDRGAWWATVHGVAKSWIQLK